MLRVAPIPIDEIFYYDQNEKIMNYTINKEFIKIGIISDFQLEDFPSDYERNINITLKRLKNKNVDVIIMAGDIVNNGYEAEYETFKRLLNSVYTDEKAKPLIFEIMGNHEYYVTKYRKIGYNLEKNIKTFKDYFRKYPFYHVKLNQFHFIFWSLQSYDYQEIYPIHTFWLKKHLDMAENDLYQSGDPIFVITHTPARYTVYGSEGTGSSKTAFDLIKNYENAFLISGHSHFSLRHERSIWQQEFTAINTQALAYMALSYNYTNGTDIVENKSLDSYMGYIANLYEQKIELH